MPECAICKRASNMYAKCIICGHFICPACFVITAHGAKCFDHVDPKSELIEVIGVPE